MTKKKSSKTGSEKKSSAQKSASKKSSAKKSAVQQPAASNKWVVVVVALGVLLFISLMANAVLGTLLFIGTGSTGQAQVPPGQAAPDAQAPSPGQPVEVAYDNAPILGDPDAPVVLVEFSDYECPFCGRFYSETLSQIKANYIDTGLAKLAYRDFPLSFHQRAVPAAIAARCVGEQLGDEGYFAMHDEIFENQRQISDANLRTYAQRVGADMGQYDTCFADADGSQEALVRADMADGQAAGVSGTPTVFVNGQRIVGAQPYAVFEAAIEAALAE